MSVIPTDLDTQLIPTILSIVTKYGKSITLDFTAKRDYNVTTGTVNTGPRKQQTTKVTPPEDYKLSQINGDTVKVGDCFVYLPGSVIAGSLPDNFRVILDSQFWTVITVGRVYSGELVALYKLQLRK